MPTPVTPKPEHGEKNTYSLPRGERLRRELRAVFGEQRRRILRFLATGRKDHATGPLPAAWPDWHDFGAGALDLARRMTPLLALTWDAAGGKFLAKIGLDPDEWSVTNPHTAEIIAQQALNFCDETNALTSKKLDVALAETREALHRGVVVEGESVRQLTKRINAIFDSAEKYRARAIAQTETSRAVHGAQEQAAIRSGVVTGWEWLLSGDACPLCVAVASRARFVRLGQPFAMVGKNPRYRECRFPPLHPHDNCTVNEVLDTDPQPAWSDTLHQPAPATEDEHRAVLEAVQARDEAILSPKPPKPVPPPRKPPARPPGASRPPKPTRPPAATRPAPAPKKPPKPGRPLEPGLPIDRRIRQSPAMDRVRELALANEAYDRLKDAARQWNADYERLSGEAQARLATGKITDAEKARYLVDLAKIESEYKAARKRRDEAKAAAEAETRRLLGLPKGARPFRWSGDHSGLTSQSSQSAARRAEAYVADILAAAPGARSTERVAWRTIPAGEEQRARCDDYAGEIHLKRIENPGVAVHELGHQIEHSVPGVRKATQEFLDYRVGNEPLKPMSQLIPGGNYGPRELGREDDFRKAFGDEAGYVGKHYANASEVISMGVQKLYNDPGDFARKDPEYCAFILGILDGSLRSP